MIIKNNTKRRPRGNGAACCSFCHHQDLACSLPVSHESGLQPNAGGRLVSTMETKNSARFRTPKPRGHAGRQRGTVQKLHRDDGTAGIEWRHRKTPSRVVVSKSKFIEIIHFRTQSAITGEAFINTSALMGFPL